MRRVIQSGLLAYFVAELRRVAKLRDARILMPDEAIRSRAIGRQARSENSGVNLTLASRCGQAPSPGYPGVSVLERWKAAYPAYSDSRRQEYRGDLVVPGLVMLSFKPRFVVHLVN